MNSQYSSSRQASSKRDLPICSVMMATYRPEEHLSEQLKSVLGQECVNIELLISDDSEDKSQLTRLLRKDSILSKSVNRSPIHVFNGPQAGLASTNFFNLVLNNSVDADYYAFADQDDIWDPSKISEAIRLLAKTDSDCYSSEFSIWKDSSPPSSSIVSQRWRIKKGMFGLFFAESAGCTYLMNRKAFLSLKERLKQIASNNMLHLVFSHDLFTSAYLHSQSFKWCHDKRSFIYYRQHQLNAWGANCTSFVGLRKRINLLISPQYKDLLYLAWRDSAEGSIASKLSRSIARLRFKDRIYLLGCVHKVLSLFNPKALGLILFILFTKKSDPFIDGMVPNSSR